MAPQNLTHSELASLTVGHTDPPLLATLLRTPQGQAVLPRVSVLGKLQRPPAGDVDYTRRRAGKAFRHALGVRSSSESGSAGGDGGDMDEDDVPDVSALSPFELQVQDVRWVDPRGGLHPVPHDDVISAYMDPFGACVPPCSRPYSVVHVLIDSYPSMCQQLPATHRCCPLSTAPLTRQWCMPASAPRIWVLR